MINDYFVEPQSREQVEEKAYAWREALKIPSEAAQPDVIGVLEINLPKIFPGFGLVIADDLEMDGAEGYTVHTPPTITLSAKVYNGALEYRPRDRMTVAHELGHLVMHNKAVPLHRAPERFRNLDKIPAFASAEYQANCFASAFLIPEWIAAQFSDAAELSEYCCVSMKAAKIKLSQVRVPEKKSLPKMVQQTIIELNKNR